MATLPASNVYFAKAYPLERLESLLDGIESAFTYFGGVVERVVLDNTSLAVKQVLAGRDRAETEAFAAFRGAYPFRAEYCAPAKGWEKGSVETGVKYVRNLVFRPRPNVESWAALNALIDHGAGYLTFRCVTSTTGARRRKRGGSSGSICGRCLFIVPPPAVLSRGWPTSSGMCGWTM